MNKERRLMLLMIPDEMLIPVLKGKVRVTNFPPDVEIVRSHYSFEMQAVQVALWSSTFEVAEDGVVLPTFQAICETVKEPEDGD